MVLVLFSDQSSSTSLLIPICFLLITLSWFPMLFWVFLFLLNQPLLIRTRLNWNCTSLLEVFSMPSINFLLNALLMLIQALRSKYHSIAWCLFTWEKDTSCSPSSITCRTVLACWTTFSKFMLPLRRTAIITMLRENSYQSIPTKMITWFLIACRIALAESKPLCSYILKLKAKLSLSSPSIPWKTTTYSKPSTFRNSHSTLKIWSSRQTQWLSAIFRSMNHHSSTSRCQWRMLLSLRTENNEHTTTYCVKTQVNHAC